MDDEGIGAEIFREIISGGDRHLDGRNLLQQLRNFHPTDIFRVRHVCAGLGTACYVRGSDKVLEEFKRVLGIEVGETTPDGKFSLDCLRCVGACGLAPVATIGE